MLLGAAPVHAETPSLATSWRVISLPAGAQGRSELALEVEIERGWHVNAHDPDRDYLVPTTLTLEPAATGERAAIRYPEPVVRELAFAGGAALRLYEGAFTIGVSLYGAVPADLVGRLRYQACTDERCLPPRVVEVAYDPAAAPRAGSGSADSGAARFASWLAERGLAATLALAVLLGLGLNLTPCVYPLISVTIAYFGGQRRDSLAGVALLAVTYVLGIAITFSALGVTAALTGGLFGAALQQPTVLAGIAIVLVALAASNFGLYQLRLPTALTQRAGRASLGAIGALGMGLTMGVVAAPCVGPIIVALLLFVAARQDAFLGFALFFALALGMGLPYVALAMAAGSIRRLPRSGEWLGWIERLFGFILVGLALYFVEPLLGPTLAAAASSLLVAVAGVYLGFLDPAGRGWGPFALAKRALGVGALVVAVWLAVPHRVESAVQWQPFHPQALAEARATRRPAIVDFTASWCLPCRENDHVTFTDPRVGSEADRFVMLRADVTEMSAETEAWIERYQVLGVPTIVFYGPDGRERARRVGFVDPGRFLELMREVG